MSLFRTDSKKFVKHFFSHNSKTGASKLPYIIYFQIVFNHYYHSRILAEWRRPETAKVIAEQLGLKKLLIIKELKKIIIIFFEI